MNTTTKTGRIAKITQRQIRRIAGILTDYLMGQRGTLTKTQCVARLASVVGTTAEAERVFGRAIRG